MDHTTYYTILLYSSTHDITLVVSYDVCRSDTYECQADTMCLCCAIVASLLGVFGSSVLYGNSVGLKLNAKESKVMLDGTGEVCILLVYEC